MKRRNFKFFPEKSPREYPTRRRIGWSWELSTNDLYVE